MNIKSIGLSLLAGTVCIGLYACSETNPPPPCNVGHGDYAAKYILQSGTGSCAQLKGEAIGLDKYYPLDGGPSLVAFQPAQATHDEVLETDKFALGALKSETPENDHCFVTSLPPIDTEVNEDFADLEEDGGLTAELIDAGTGLDAGQTVCDADGCRLVFAPAVPLKYEFGDVDFFVIPSAPSAQQFTTTLKYTEDTCTATYKVVGMYPAVACESDIDCDPNSDYDAGRIFGSGIFYTFDTFCDTDTGLCQLKSDEIGPSTLKQP